MFDSESREGFDDDEPFAKRQRKNFDPTCKFQMIWVAKLMWVKGILLDDGVLYMVKCTTCSIFKKNSCILIFKWDILVKHKRHLKIKRNMLKYNVKKGNITLPKTVDIGRTCAFTMLLSLPLSSIRSLVPFTAMKMIRRRFNLTFYFTF